MAQPKRTKSRERAVQALYQIDVAASDLDEALARFWRSFEPVEREVMELADSLVRGVAGQRREIDELIESVSRNWRLDRMARVDRNVLRLAVHELLCRREVPVKVVINEAIELGKKFGSEGSGAFINGVLDRIAASLPASRRADGRNDAGR
ncbi:MAG TPA: transcription antitermination factor NusB [Anaeromyxobacteraceae bacterium]|nr:transcription antitermination factor NusB [Anaeromyxobacteraceae bacterium]